MCIRDSSEALSLINKAAGYRREVKVHLASGFTPLHLKSFLTAFLQRENLTARIMVETGMFDDLVGNVMRMGQSGSALGVCVMEWPDFDPRLGAVSYTHLAGVSATVPLVACGHRNLPRSSLFAKRQRPSPSHHNILIKSPRRPRKTNTCPENGFSLRAVCTIPLKPVNPRRRSVTPAAIQIRVPAGSPIIRANTPARCAVLLLPHCP